MDNIFPHRALRLKQFKMALVIILLILAACIVILNQYLIPHREWFGIKVMQVAVPILAIAFAGMMVSLPGKVVRSKITLLLMFFVVMGLGIHVYSGISRDERPMDIVYVLLFPFDSSMSAFFPSRGDYGVSSSWPADIRRDYLVFHALAYFYFAWLGFAVFGRKLLNRVMIHLIHPKYKNIIWGFSDGAFELAKDMIRNTHRDEPVFILDDDIEFNEEEERRIFNKLSNESIIVINSHYGNLSENPRDFDAHIYSWYHWRRMLTSGRFFKGHRHYFITEDQDFNVKYALKILTQLGFMSCKIKDVHLYVRTELEGVDLFFQNKIRKTGLSGKVEVHIFNQSDITARQFVEKYPVLDLMKRYNPTTGEKWLTLDDELLTIDGEVNILLLGLGWTGYEMMKKLVCDAQYLGDYKFNLVVIDNTYKDNNGQYQYMVREARRFGMNICINPLVWMDDQHQICCQQMRGGISIRQEGLDEKRITQSNGHMFYQWLGFEEPEVGAPNIIRFNRIIVALGNDEVNVNTALQLTKFRNSYLGAIEANNIDRMPEPVYAHVQDNDRYEFYENDDSSPIRVFGNLKSIYNVHHFVADDLNNIGKLVNHVYWHPDIAVLSEEMLLIDMNDGSVGREWAGCSIFDKDSSRSVAMNLMNVVTIAGGTAEAIEQKVRNSVCLERLAEMEHKRWNAFHYMKGICSWKIDEVEPVTINGKKKINGKLSIGGSLVRHICLVDFSELDEATTRINLLGNIGENFKETDRRIIRHFPQFYRIYKQYKTQKS